VDYTKLYKNWFVRNCVLKPISFVAYHSARTLADERSATKLRDKIDNIAKP
jgi:hypothetical protein